TRNAQLLNHQYEVDVLEWYVNVDPDGGRCCRSAAGSKFKTHTKYGQDGPDVYGPAAGWVQHAGPGRRPAQHCRGCLTREDREDRRAPWSSRAFFWIRFFNSVCSCP